VMPAVHLPVLAASLIALVAAFTDIRWRRVPNWLTGAALLLGLTLNLVLPVAAVGLSGLPGGLLTWLLGAALGFVFLFPFYAIRLNGLGHLFGAGDVKLLATIGAIVGPQAIISIALYSAIAGAVQSVLIMAQRRRIGLVLQQGLVMQTLPGISGIRAPYAIAICAGVIASMFLPAVVRF
jgi:prepilin peptidase CpaA